jgi:hypothetical protein
VGYTFLLFVFLNPQPAAGSVLLPGGIFGMYAGVFISGNPHGGEVAVLIVSGAVNFFVYASLVYFVLYFLEKNRNKTREL